MNDFDTDADTDVVIVGAGPAGSTAALVLARAGRKVILLERGPFPGSKNMFGGVIYGRVLDRLLPGWYEEAPIQRWVTRRSTMILTQDQALTVDFRSSKWGEVPYNGATAFRPDFDSWLADKAVEAGADLICSTTATGLLFGPRGEVIGVKTDRPDGDLRASLVIACDGVNSFLAKEAGLYPDAGAEHFTLGVKETIRLPRSVIEDRFGIRGNHGVDIEVLGAAPEVAGGGFLYTNLDSVSVGLVLDLEGLKSCEERPEELLAAFKVHPAIAPLLEGGEIGEYSAHLVPEGGYDAMPDMVTSGMMVAGDAAGMCLAAGLWLEGVNMAIGGGEAAGLTALEALRRGDFDEDALSGYRRRLEEGFVLADHKSLRGAPGLVLSERMQNQYPGLLCDVVEELFTVTNPTPKAGLTKIMRRAAKQNRLRLRDLVRDARDGLRVFG